MVRRYSVTSQRVYFSGIILSPICRQSFGALNIAGLCIFVASAKQHNNPRALPDEIKSIPRSVVNAHLGHAVAYRLGITEIPQFNLNQPGVNSFNGPFVSKAIEPPEESISLDNFYHGLLCAYVHGLASARMLSRSLPYPSASASTSARWRARRLVPCSICWRQETPITATSQSGPLALTCGNRACSPMVMEMS